MTDSEHAFSPQSLMSLGESDEHEAGTDIGHFSLQVGVEIEFIKRCPGLRSERTLLSLLLLLSLWGLQDWGL